MGKSFQTIVSKVKEKEESKIDTLTRLVNSLTTEVSKLKQRMANTYVSSRPPRFSQRKNVTTSSSSHPAKSV